MGLIDKLRYAYYAFRVAGTLARRVESGAEFSTELAVAQLSLYEKSAAVYACIKLRADALARPTLAVYQTKGGTNVKATGHPLQKLLDKPNPFWTRGQLWRALETDLCWHGNAYWAYEGLEQFGKPVEIWRLRPDWTQVIADKTKYIKGYKHTVDGQDYPWTADEITHFRYANPFSEFYGLSPLHAARLSAEMGYDALTSNRYFFKNYALPATGLKTKEPMSKEQADEMIMWWNEAMRGVTKQHRTVILPFGLEPHQLSISPKDIEWMEGMKWSLEDVARVYRVPSPLIGQEKAVYKNIKEAETALWHETIIPELLWIEEILNAELVPLFGDNDILVRFDVSSVEALQEDANLLADRMYKLWQMGVPLNKILNEMMPSLLPLEGKGYPWGDVWWAPLNLMPTGSMQERAQEPKATETKSYLLPTTDALSRQEIGALATIIRDFFETESKLIADAFSRSVRQASYDWNRWLRLLGTPVANVLRNLITSGAADASKTIGVEIDFELVNERATKWSSAHSAELLGVGAQHKLSITEATRHVVNDIITQAVDEGWSANTIRQRIMGDACFSAQRAMLVARTESQRAYNVGNIEGYKASGVVTGKSWLGGVNCCDVCAVNSAQGVIPLGNTFSSGHDAPPAHPNCLCRLLPHKESE